MFTRVRLGQTLGNLIGGVLALVCAGVPVSLAQVTDAPSLPTWRIVERSHESVPLGTVVIGDAPALTNAPRENAVELSQYGFVEEEYFVSGTANVYEPGTTLIKSTQPYTTRIIVRRPLDTYKFSGSAHMEAFADETERVSTWLRAWPYFVSNGDIWIGISVSSANVEHMHKVFDAARYDQLQVPDDEMRWDIMAQVAWLMRSPDGPLAKLHYHDQSAITPGLFRVYASGWAHTGCVVSDFVNNGHHQLNRRPNGRPVIDGYVSGLCPQGTPLQVPADAAVMQIMSESEYESPQSAVTIAARQPDGSSPLERRYRWYDVAGASRAGFLDQPQFSISAFQMGWTERVSIACDEPLINSSAMNEVARVSLRNLDEWIRIGYHPPEGEVFNLDDTGVIARDEYGNAIGGSRSHATEVPISTFTPRSEVSSNATLEALGGDCAQFGHEQPFSSALVEKLHGDSRAYLEKVTDSVILLVNSRRLLEIDADAYLGELRSAYRK
jgi:hypothetical protein